MATRRWIVTYTKHMKQKRKVYQDGVLELCSSSGTPQVILYDDFEKVIDRRFLKKEEVVKSGASLSFETHIVEIGDPDGSYEPSTESNVKSSTRPESQIEKLCVEWNVLYTTQKTQKAKRYHDGVLRLTACSSHLNSITLLNEDGAILSSKYLKSVACLETGNNCEFPNYLVEICERRASAANQADSSNISFCNDLLENGSSNQVPPCNPERCEKLGSCKNILKFALHNDLQRNSSKKVANNCSSKVGNCINSIAVPLRDAWQILSVLKKPSPEGGNVLEDPLVEQCLTSQSSDNCQLDLQGLNELSSEKTGTSAWHGLKSTNSQGPSVSADMLVIDADCGRSTSADYRASSGGSSGVVKSSIKNKPDKPISDTVSCLSEENSDADETSTLPEMDIKGIISDSAPNQNLVQLSPKDTKHEPVSCSGASTVHSISGTIKDLQILKSPELADVADFPTFDLGF